MKKRRVLIVDDVKNIREMLKTCLESEGYCVFEASSAKQAMNIIEKEQINIVFSDIKMPEINGTELLKMIKRYNKSIIVIIMTAFGTVKNGVECTKYGASAYLQKPFTAKRVKGVLSEVLEKETLRTNINVYVVSAKKLIESGDLKKAHDILKKGLTIRDDCGELYYLIGKIEELNGNIEKSKHFKEFATLLGFSEKEIEN